MSSRTPVRLLACALLAVAVGSTAPALADQQRGPTTDPDVPQWGPAEPWAQFQDGPGHPGAVPDGPEPPYEVAWRYEPDGLGGSSAAVVSGDTAYAVTPKHVVAVDVATGEQRWVKDRAEAPVSGPAVTMVGDATSLLYTEGKGKDTVLVDLNADTRERRWEVELDDDSTTGVTVDDGRAYVGNDVGQIFAVDIVSGKTVWTTDEPGGKVVAPLAVVDGRVVYASADEVKHVLRFVALSADNGERDWMTEPKAVGATAFTGSGSDLLTAVLGYAGGQVLSLDAASGAQGWDSRLRGAVSSGGSVAVSSGRAFVIDQAAGIYAIDLNSGERLWDFQENGTAQGAGAPVVLGGFVMSGFQDGSAVAIDTDTGHLAWRGDVAPNTLKAPAVAGDLIVFGTGGADGGMIALRHTDGALLDEVSPTVLDPSRVAIAFLIPLVALPILLFLLGRVAGPWLWRRGADADEDADALVPEEPDAEGSS